jgi:hypothetical protein
MGPSRTKVLLYRTIERNNAPVQNSIDSIDPVVSNVPKSCGYEDVKNSLQNWLTAHGS